jgi:CheY-like chemotaxis protein
VNTSASRNVEGTGLGLAITRRLAGMMDGTVTVESAYGKGTVFHVRLRQSFVSDAPIGSEVAKNIMNSRYTVSKREAVAKLMRVNMSYAYVLVVDDVTTNLDVARGMLKPYGMRVDCVLSGQEAIDKIKAGDPRYTAIFMDHMMPGMDGIEATRIIREEIATEYARNIPIIALTANAVIGNEEMFLQKGFQAFISKPIDIMKMDSILRQWVRDKSKEKKTGETGDNAESLSGENGHDSRAGGNEMGLDGISIRGLDIRMGLERFDQDEELYLTVLQSYAKNTRPILDNMSESLGSGNLEDYAIAVHGVKGSSYGVSARETGKAAEDLETAAKAGNLEVVNAGHLIFVKATEAFLDRIDAALDQGGFESRQ